MSKDKQKGRNLKVLITLGSIIIVNGTLIYLEQVALIYVLSTIALIVLLLVVAFADLEKVGQEARTEAFGTKPTDEEVAILTMNKFENIEHRKREKHRLAEDRAEGN